MFMDDHTVAQIAPSGLFLGTGAISGAFVQINCGNPLCPRRPGALRLPLMADCNQSAATASRTERRRTALAYRRCGLPATGNCNLTLCQRFSKSAAAISKADNRVDDLRHTAYRMHIGARGDLGDGWNYDVYGHTA